MPSEDYLIEWKLSTQSYGCGGPIIDHWVTMLATLLQPIMYVTYSFVVNIICTSVVEKSFFLI